MLNTKKFGDIAFRDKDFKSAIDYYSKVSVCQRNISLFFLLRLTQLLISLSHRFLIALYFLSFYLPSLHLSLLSRQNFLLVGFATVLLILLPLALPLLLVSLHKIFNVFLSLMFFISFFTHLPRNSPLSLEFLLYCLFYPLSFPSPKFSLSHSLSLFLISLSCF